MKHYILLAFLTSILFFIFFFRLTDSFRMPPMYNYDSDFGRDLLVMEKINQGKFTLVGPQFSFAGLRLSPYHFYLFAPFLLIGDYRMVIYANALIFLAGLILVFILLSKKTNVLTAFLAVIWIATTSYIILSARSPGNAFSYLIFLLIYLFYIFNAKKLSLKISMILGFTAGIFINYHPMSTVSAVLPFVVLLYFYKDILKNKLLYAGIFTFSLLVSFMPVLLFDLKHQFVITKSVFSERAFEFGGWAPHYSLPIFILFQVIFIIIIAKFRYTYLILSFLIFINLIYFPFKLYKPARNLNDTEKKFSQIITKMNLPKNHFNIILINDTYLSAVGYEYRYLLTKRGYQLDDEYSYRNSKYLLLIAENNKDIESFKSWEMDEFGRKKIINKSQIDNMSVFLYAKN